MSTYALNPNPSDAFTNILADLNDIASKVSKMTEPLDKLHHTIDESSQIVHKIDNLFVAVDDVYEAIKVARDACWMLSGIPVVGEIADLAADVLSDASAAASRIQNILHPMRNKVEKIENILDKADHGVAEIHDKVSTMADKIPDYTNTIAILNCLVNIAQPLTEVLQGDDAAERLDKLVQEFETIRDDVSAILLPIVEVVDELVTIVQEFEENLLKICESIGSSLDSAISTLSNVTDLIHPLTSAFHTVEDAIAPVKWALSAVECIIEKVFSPVINAVLEATGLQSLVDSLKNEIMHKLGIDSIITNIEQTLQLDILQNYGGFFDLMDPCSKGAVLINGWPKLAEVLDQYSTNGNEGRKIAIQELLSAIAGTAIDLTKPAVIVDWPDVPDMKTPDSAPLKQSPLHQIALAQKLDHSSLKLCQTQEVSLRPKIRLLSAASPTVGEYALNDRWSSVKDLNQKIDEAVENLNTVHSDALTLESKLSNLNSSLQTPATFHEQITDLKVYLVTGRDLFKFIESYNIFPDILSPVENILGTQACACEEIETAMPTLLTAVSQVGVTINSILQHTPSSQTIAKTTQTLHGWKTGIVSLIQTVDTGYNLSTDPTHIQKLDESTQQINQRCADVTKIIEDIINTAEQLNTHLTSLAGSLDKYATALKVVTDHDQLISEHALPTAKKVADILNTVDSIFDPLSELLKSLNCVDSGNLMKQGANTTLNLLKSTSQTSCVPGMKLLVAGLNMLADNVLPLGRLHQDVQAATVTLNNQVIGQLDLFSKDLINTLDHLSDQLVLSCQYSFTDQKGQEKTANNQFINADGAALAVDVTNSIGKLPSVSIQKRQVVSSK